jgi:hypothetical protein
MYDSNSALVRCLPVLSEERQETCIHCNSTWYAMHYEDGACHACQQKGLPGRRVLEQRQQLARVISVCVMVVLFALVLLFGR